MLPKTSTTTLTLYYGHSATHGQGVRATNGPVCLLPDGFIQRLTAHRTPDPVATGPFRSKDGVRSLPWERAPSPMRVSHKIPPGEEPFFDRSGVSFPGLNPPYWVSNVSGLLITSLPNQAVGVRNVVDTVSSGHRFSPTIRHGKALPRQKPEPYGIRRTGGQRGPRVVRLSKGEEDSRAVRAIMGERQGGNRFTTRDEMQGGWRINSANVGCRPKTAPDGSTPLVSKWPASGASA